jgi:hydroxyacylglutathione hydrolase
MIFTWHYLVWQSQASYVVGDETAGRALMVDPRRSGGVYPAKAAAWGLTIGRVSTHVQADFLAAISSSLPGRVG